MNAPEALMFRILRDAASQEIVRAEREARREGVTLREYIGNRMAELDMAPAKRAYWAQLVYKRVCKAANEPG